MLLPTPFGPSRQNHWPARTCKVDPPQHFVSCRSGHARRECPARSKSCLRSCPQMPRGQHRRDRDRPTVLARLDDRQRCERQREPDERRTRAIALGHADAAREQHDREPQRRRSTARSAPARQESPCNTTASAVRDELMRQRSPAHRPGELGERERCRAQPVAMPISPSATPRAAGRRDSRRAATSRTTLRPTSRGRAGLNREHARSATGSADSPACPTRELAPAASPRQPRRKVWCACVP